jgi:hypothetical protein
VVRNVGLALVVALAACGGDDDTIDDPVTGADAGVPLPDAAEPAPDAAVGQSCNTSPSFELGSGIREWQAVNDGDLLYLYRGPQGGYMVYLAVRASGFDTTNSTLCYDLHLVDTDKPAGEGCWNIRLPNDLGDGVYERLGIWGQVDEAFWTKVNQIRGHTLRVETELTDPSGCKASDGWTVAISPDKPE